MTKAEAKRALARGAFLSVATLVLGLLPAADALAWWNKDWSHRRKLTFDNAARAETLSGFQVLVVLNATRIEYARTRNDGFDLRFVDANDSLLLDYEIESWNESGNSYVWVRVPTIEAGSNTRYVWMYYGNPAAANVQNPNAVWAGYSMVQHLQEPFPSQHLDSTANANHSVAIDVQTQASPLGLIGPADFFSSAGGGTAADNVDVGDAATLDMAANESFLIEAWVNATPNGQYQMVVSKENFGTGTQGEIQLGIDSGNNAHFWLRDGVAGSAIANSGTVAANGGWRYLVGRWNEATGTAEVFVDGVSAASAGGALAAVQTATPLVIGQEGDADRGYGVDGRIDEVRVWKTSGAVRSDLWIDAQYDSMRDSGVGLVGPFVSYGAEAAHCCDLQVTEAATTLTVTATNRFRAVYALSAGGSMEQLYDLEEDPGASLDLAGAVAGSPSPRGLHNTGVRVAGTYYNTGINDNGARIDLLEATPARVKLRQESFYQSNTGVRLGGLKAVADHVVYPVGRTALRWRRRATAPAGVTYTTEFHETMVRHLAAGPLANTLVYFQLAGAGVGTGLDAFALTQNESAGTPGARTDFLNIIQRDWSTVQGHLATADLTDRNPNPGEERINAYWVDTTGATILPGAGPYVGQGETWDFLAYLKPATIANHADTAATSRSADYRGPDALTVGPGSAWSEASQNTSAGDDFNEAEAAYVLTLDPTPGQGLTFQIDGSAGTPRHYPFFKIRQWRSFQGTPVVRLNGGSPLAPGTRFRSAVKPLSRAHWASTLDWHCTMDSTTACNAGNLDVGTGVGGSTSGTVTVQAGRYGNALLFDQNADGVTAAASDFNRNVGAVDLWYQPRYNHNDGNTYLLWYNRAGTGPYHCFALYKDGVTNALAFTVIVGAPNPTCDGGGTAYTASAPVGAYSWRAYDWVHLKSSWNAAGAAGTRKLRIVMNGVEVATSATFTAPPTSTTPIFGGCSSNCPYGVGAHANGLLDEVHIYGGLELSSYDTNTPLAHAGLTSDAREYLADTADNWPLALTPVAGDRGGSYFYFGADSTFRGLNVALQTPGVWATTPGDLVWEYWNGSQWATLESGFGFTDETSAFTRNGTIYWTSDPAGWAPYSVNGGPDLYYVRVHLAAGVLSYSTQPQERLIKTDVLLFQYCHDITAAAQTFAFAVPWSTTEVRLESFTASPGDGSVLLEWRTGSELDNLGFHLYRATAENGPWTRLTGSLIPGLGSSAVGQAYSWRDSGLANGTRYFYRLEDVDAASKATAHGPVSAVPQPAARAEGGGGARGRDEKRGSAPSASCPAWVLAAYDAPAGSDASLLRCTRHGDPEATSLATLSRSERQATLELRTGGFYALHEPGGTVRVFVPGFDFPQDEAAAALPVRRALAEAVVGRRVQLAGARALALERFRDLVPAALGKAEMRTDWDGTARPGRRSSRARARQLPTSELVTLLPSQFQGEKKSAAVEIAPLRYDATRRQLVLAKRVRFRLLFTGREPGESGRGSLGRAPRPRKPADASTVLARLYTAGRGLHAASFEQLFPGERRGVVASELRLERQGEPVAFQLLPSSSSFGPGGRLLFHAEAAPSSTDFSGELAYELVRSAGGLRMSAGSAAPGNGAATTTPPLVSRSFETNRYYQPGLLEAEDPWLWEALASGVTRVVPFSLASPAPSGSATLEVRLQGASESGSAVDHHLSASLNGTPVGELLFAGKQPQRMRLELPAALLREGSNELALTSVADTGVSSLVFLDRFELVHPQAASLAAGRFDGAWSESGTASVAGVPAGAALVDVSGPVPRWLNGYELASGSLRFHAEAGRRYLVTAPEALLVPRVAPASASSLRSAANQADYLLIAPQAFLHAAEPLVARRRDQGLAARAVAFEEIRDAFGHGQPSAEAIRSFLAHAYHAWARPSPRYVLLLGDASYDPRNFMGSSPASPLPALWTRTSYLWTASDPLLAAVNGEDPVPDLAIGRLPASTPEQAQALVAKLLAWEDSAQGLAGPALLVADNPDLAGDFEADAEDIRASFLAAREARVLKLAELGADTRPAILDALNTGLGYLGYVGHGGAAVWASENVWNSWDAQGLLAQSRQPLLVTMNCLNGYFVAPAFDSLAESLVKAEGRGAFAAFSPSGLSLDGPAHQYHRALAAELTSDRHPRLGDAILAAQLSYAETGLMPELLAVYHLIGDPATLIR